MELVANIRQPLTDVQRPDAYEIYSWMRETRNLVHSIYSMRPNDRGLVQEWAYA